MAKRRAVSRGRRSKYGAVPTISSGIRFHSRREAARYSELLALAKVHEITLLELQPRFVLQAHDRCGPVKLGVYVADFRYVDTQTRAVVIEDVKGFKTPLYRWKKKHVEAQYGITITEV
jgi:hypothetical protein